MIRDKIRSSPGATAVLLVLGILAFSVLAWWFADILAPFFIAFLLAYILDPAVDWMVEHFGSNRMTAILVLLLLGTLGISVLGYYLLEEAIVFGNQIQELLREPPALRDWIDRMLPEYLTSYFDVLAGKGTEGSLYDRIGVFIRRNLSEFASGLTGPTHLVNVFLTRTMGMLTFVLNTVVVIFVTIYFLRDFDRIVRGIREEVPVRYRERTDRFFSEINELLRAFLRGHLIICLVVGMLYGLGYLIVGLKGGLLIGVLSGLMNVIPYVGASFGFLLAFVLALMQFGLSSLVLAVVGVFVVVQSLEGNILRPTILGAAVGMNPVTVIFALMFFGKLMGFLGLLLAVPIAAVFKVILNHLLESYHETDFYRRSDDSR